MGPPLKDVASKIDRVKVVFKHFPLTFHKQAMSAAIASVCAHKQGKFWEFHDKLFANQKDLAEDKYEGWAQESGVADMAKFKACLTSEEAKAVVQKDMDEATKAGLRGTLSIYINGRKFEAAGGFSPDAFSQVINKYFKK